MSESSIASIALAGVSRTYGSTRALERVDLPLYRGEVVALLGENGAGKSTAAKILCGLERPDEGSVEIDGAPASLSGPRAARGLGIYMIPQELAYVPDLTVAENIVLGWTPHRFGFTSQRAMLAAAAAQAARFDFDLRLDRPMRQLPLADIQMVEILKALRVNALAIVLDEPTSALTEDESRRLFAACRRLADEGTAVAFVSHRLDEVLDGSDRVHVFRDGRIVRDVETRSTTRAELLEAMLGHPLVTTAGGAVPADGRSGMTIVDWSSVDPPLSPVSLEFFAGEVTVLYGLRGSGSQLLAAGLVGARRLRCPRMTVGGKTVRSPRHPKAARRQGIAYVPPDRRRQGLFMHLSVEENLVAHVRSFSDAWGWRRVRTESATARRAMERYDIRAASSRQPVSELSGGNQQKVLLAGRLACDPKVLVLEEPTRGVDIGARDEIHDILRRYARAGATAIVSTSDFEEALQLADRMVVFRGGAVVGDLRGRDRPAALDLARGR
jgi:ABC-type sugar transport system ATPase subunit